MKSFALLACLAVLMRPGIVVAQTDAVAEQMQCFKDAKFGMFIHFQAPRSGDFNPSNLDTAEAKRVVPEDENRYPEQFFFGVLPAWGAYIRHAKNIEFKNVELTLRGEDARQKIVLDDVEGFVEN